MLSRLDQVVRFGEERPSMNLLHNSADFRIVTIGLRQGQRVDPHTSTSSVLLHVVRGRGVVQKGEERLTVEPGCLVVCAPNEPHGIEAEEEMAVVAVIAPRP